MIPSQEQEKWIYKKRLISRFIEESIQKICVEGKRQLLIWPQTPD